MRGILNFRFLSAKVRYHFAHLVAFMVVAGHNVKFYLLIYKVFITHRYKFSGMQDVCISKKIFKCHEYGLSIFTFIIL